MSGRAAHLHRSLALNFVCVTVRGVECISFPLVVPASVFQLLFLYLVFHLPFGIIVLVAFLPFFLASPPPPLGTINLLLSENLM